MRLAGMSAGKMGTCPNQPNRTVEPGALHAPRGRRSWSPERACPVNDLRNVSEKWQMGGLAVKCPTNE
jgi:hypothetical protein